MNSPAPAAVRPRLAAAALALLALGVGRGPVRAQAIITLGPPTLSGAAPAAVTPPADSAPDLSRPAPPGPNPFRWGPFTLRPRFALSHVRARALQVRPGLSVDTSIQSYSAGGVLELGRHWTLDGALGRSLYSHAAYRDPSDRTLSLSGGTIHRDLALRFTHAYAHHTLPLAETASQITQRAHDTTFAGAVVIGDRSRVEFNLQQKRRTAEATPTVREWPVEAWWVHRLAPGLDLAAGASAAFADIRPGADMLHRRPHLRLTWRPHDRLLVQATGGQDHGTFYARRTTDLRRPVYAARVELRPRRTTALSAEAGREIALSYFSDQVSENERYTLGLRQRLLGRCHLDAAFEHKRMDYLRTDLQPWPPGSARLDTRRILRLRLSTPLGRHGSFALVLQRDDNASSLAGYSYVSDQFGVELGSRF